MATIPVLGTYPAVHVANAGVMPASQQYVSAEDQLLINAWNSAPGAQLEVRWRIMRADGVVVTDHQSVVLTSARATVAVMLPLCEGFLLGVTAAVSGATPKRGQCFVQIGLARGTVANPEQGAVLISDYCTSLDFACWPGGLLRSPLEGPGVLRSITGTDPAAGVEIIETVPTNARWRLVLFNYTLVTSAAVANREPSLEVDDGTTQLLRLANASLQTAGTTRVYTAFAAGFAPSFPTVVNFSYIEIPRDVILMAGWRLRTITANIDVGDNYAAPQYVVEEWIDV